MAIACLRRCGKGDRPSRRHRDDGAVALELVLVAPILLLLVFGIINFGVLFAQKLAINNAVREGARAAVVGAAQYNPVDVEAKVRTALGGTIAMDPTQVTVTPTGTCADAGVGNDYTVTAEFDAPLLMPLFIPTPFTNADGKVPLDGTAVYRCEW